MKLNVTKRIVKEDFKPEDQELVGKLGFTLNPFFEQISQVLNKNLTIEENFNMEVKIIDLKVDAGGLPTTTAAYQSTLRTKVRGTMVMDARNLTNTTTYPTSGPFINFLQENNLVTIQHVTGLQAGDNYRLTVLSIG